MIIRWVNGYYTTPEWARFKAELDNEGFDVHSVNELSTGQAQDVGLKRPAGWNPDLKPYRVELHKLELQPRTCRWCDSPVDDDTFERFDETAVCSDECDTYLRLEARAEAMIDQIEWERQ